MPLQTEANEFCYPFHNMDRPNGMILPLSRNIQVSIQWNWCNYCDNYMEMPDTRQAPQYVSNTVEIAFIKEGEFIRPKDWDDDVKGHLTVRDMWREIHNFQKEYGLLSSSLFFPDPAP